MEATTIERRYLRYKEAEQYTGYHRVTCVKQERR